MTTVNFPGLSRINRVILQVRLLISCELHLIREFTLSYVLSVAQTDMHRIITLTANDLIIRLYKKLRRGTVA